MANGIEGVISEQVKTLISIKADIASAIVSLGGNVTVNDAFSSYADKIRGLDPKSTLDLGTLNITENGSYSASAEGMDGFSSVTVHVSGSGGSDGGYDPSDPDSGGGSPGGGIGGDDDVPTFTVTFTCPGASTDESSEYYWPDVEVEVKYGKSVDLNKIKPPKKENMIFKGWDPMPTAVTEDMKCIAQFGDPTAEITDSWETIANNGGAPYEIGQYKELPLGKIRTKQTANFNIGTSTIVKPTQTTQFTFEYDQKVSGRVIMQKVAEGEDGTTSTWLSKGIIETPNLRSGYWVPITYPWRLLLNPYAYCDQVTWAGIATYKENVKPINWPDCDLRKWLNDETGAIGGVFYAIDPVISSKIKTVTKYSQGYNERTDGVQLGGVVSHDKLWIPSYSEIISTSNNTYSEDGASKSISYNTKNYGPSTLATLSSKANYNQSGYRTRSVNKNSPFYQGAYISSYNSDNKRGEYIDVQDCNTGISGKIVGIRLGFCL